MSTNTVVRLKITLDAVKPAVLRRSEAPFDIRLDRLHLTIQAGLGWTNSHLYEIRAGDVGWSTLYPEADWPEDFLDARKARLNKVIEDVGTRRCATFTTLAMAGSTRSRWSSSPSPSQALSIRA